MKHVNADKCPRCEETLKKVHPDLARWVGVLRSTHKDAHVSCGYRGEAEQEAAFKAGNSKARFGQSPHNLVPAQAVDFFRLTQSGGASFDAPFYRDTIAPIARAAGLTWGGDWKSFKDMPHVEMPDWRKAKK
jgi:peptidoglycan L-alanyl-D-glutamate endopeptidase CwlK